MMLDKLKVNREFAVAIAIVAILLVGFVLCGIVDYFHPPEKATSMSQSQAESEAGINTAAHNAQIPLSASQSKEVVTQIREIHTTEQVPIYVVQSTGSTVSQDVEQAREDNKADFAVVTDLNHPEQEVKLDELDDNAKVELNQYNIQAYKSVIRQIEAGKVAGGDGFMIGGSVSRKITKDGQYLGIGADYIRHDGEDIAVVKIVYSF
ncbi:MAG: hypothetical protein ACI4P9_04465 [Selenomonadaceae bacterium]